MGKESTSGKWWYLPKKVISAPISMNFLHLSIASSTPSAALASVRAKMMISTPTMEIEVTITAILQAMHAPRILRIYQFIHPSCLPLTHIPPSIYSRLDPCICLLTAYSGLALGVSAFLGRHLILNHDTSQTSLSYMEVEKRSKEKGSRRESSSGSSYSCCRPISGT